MNVANVQENMNWYIANQSNLVKKYRNKYIVIFDKVVMDWFCSKVEALNFGREHYGMGNFVMLFCSEGDEAYTIKNPSRYASY